MSSSESWSSIASIFVTFSCFSGLSMSLFFLFFLSTQQPSLAHAGPQCVLHAAGHDGAAGGAPWFGENTCWM